MKFVTLGTLVAVVTLVVAVIAVIEITGYLYEHVILTQYDIGKTKIPISNLQFTLPNITSAKSFTYKL